MQCLHLLFSCGSGRALFVDLITRLFSSFSPLNEQSVLALVLLLVFIMISERIYI